MAFSVETQLTRFSADSVRPYSAATHTVQLPRALVRTRAISSSRSAAMAPAPRRVVRRRSSAPRLRYSVSAARGSGKPPLREQGDGSVFYTCEARTVRDQCFGAFQLAQWCARLTVRCRVEVPHQFPAETEATLSTSCSSAFVHGSSAAIVTSSNQKGRLRAWTIPLAARSSTGTGIEGGRVSKKTHKEQYPYQRHRQRQRAPLIRR